MTAAAHPATLAAVDHERALSKLPQVHTHALRLRDAGMDEAGIARRLEIPLEAVRPLLRVAEAKLARLVAFDDGRRDG